MSILLINPTSDTEKMMNTHIINVKTMPFSFYFTIANKKIRFFNRNGKIHYVYKITDPIKRERHTTYSIDIIVA